MIAVTGATGKLGHLVVESLLQKEIPAAEIVAVVRNPQKAADYVAHGVQVRQADYNKPETWTAALAGVDRLLLISSNELGQRVAQHKAVIDAAVKAKTYLVYTSLLNAEKSTMAFADEHRQTEALLRASGLRVAILRNGWYTENWEQLIATALRTRVIYGCAEKGLISAASRVDYAEAAATVLLSQDPAEVYELAADISYSLPMLADELTRQEATPNRPFGYENISEVSFKAWLEQNGVLAPASTLLASAETAAAKGELFNEDHALAKLIGRPATATSTVVADIRMAQLSANAA